VSLLSGGWKSASFADSFPLFAGIVPDLAMRDDSANR